MSQHAIWGATLRKAVLLQWSVVLGLSVAAWAVVGQAAAWSLLCGGAAVALPNAVLAGWLLLKIQQGEAAGAMALMRGETFKLGMTVVLLALAGSQMRPVLIWPALLVGVVGALMAQWWSLWLTRRY